MRWMKKTSWVQAYSTASNQFSIGVKFEWGKENDLLYNINIKVQLTSNYGMFPVTE